MLSAKLVAYEWREKVSAFSLFLLLIVKSCQNYGVTLLQSNPIIVFVMSLWDWLLAAWIYEELFDDDSNDRSCDDTRDHDSSCD